MVNSDDPLLAAVGLKPTKTSPTQSRRQDLVQKSSSSGSTVVVSEPVLSTTTRSTAPPPPTRFSFYDAEQVQRQWTAKDGSNQTDQAPVPQDASSGRKMKQQTNEENRKPQQQSSETQKKQQQQQQDRYHFYDDVSRQQAVGTAQRGAPLILSPSSTKPAKLHPASTKASKTGDSTEDILRSLQETEDQRNNILKESNAGQHDQALAPRSASSPKKLVVDTNDRGLNPAQSEETNSTNPYEDAIQEALDLLRKHRTPVNTPSEDDTALAATASATPPSSILTSPKTAATMSSETASTNSLSSGLMPRTPKENDKLLQHRNDEDEDGTTVTADNNDSEVRKIPELAVLTDAYEEHKLKAKQRQERMAEYASRLQEFKSTLPQQQSLQRPLGLASPTSKGPMEEQEQSDPQDWIPRVSTNTDESAAAFSDISQSTKHTVESQVQKGVERVLMAILEKANHASTSVTTDQGSAPPTSDFVRDAVTNAMSDIMGSSSEDDDGKLKSKASTDSGKHSQRSVVDELLAEEDDHIRIQLASPTSTGMAFDGHSIEEKKLEDQPTRYEPVLEATRAEYPSRNENLVDAASSETRTEGSEGVLSEEYSEEDVDRGTSSSQTSSPRAQTRVLGPLSKQDGGTTGVVLDVDQDQKSEGPASDILGGLNNVVNYVTSALTTAEQAGEDVKEKGHMEYEDVEAMELMRTLCAHLLPFGVDVRASSLLDSIPDWDESNGNEAGYRIIRLSKSQLRRVERAFEAMIHSLKRNSERRLEKPDEEDSDTLDDNFVKELQEAERLLDDEEKRLKQAEGGQPVAPKSLQLDAHTEPSQAVQAKTPVNEAPGHPSFPGVKANGQGEMGDLEYFHLPVIFKSKVTGFEPTKDLVLEPGNVIAGQYLVENELGSAAFSTAYRCIDLSSDDEDGHEEVCLKVIKNTKDFFDQSLDEIKILELLRQTGQVQENHVLEMKTFFYYREHLVIVTELLRQNLFEFGKFVLDNNEETYFTVSRLAYITRQALISLKFVHNLGLVHSDVKPENMLLGSYSRAQVKLIDFGSSCYLTDRQSSYIQSRSYRAPEVVLGLPYSGKIDVWSLGCVIAEMYTGEVTFQNDSIVSMLSRIEAICGPFPRHMIAQGRQSGRFFTKSGLLFEHVNESDRDNHVAPGPLDDESEGDDNVQFDIFQPKKTCLASRLGFDANLMEDYSEEGLAFDNELHGKQMFTDFVGRLLTIDPDGRPTAEEALHHPWMMFAASLTEEQIKYPST